MSLFPVCCYTCRKVINPLYEPFKAGIREIQQLDGKITKHEQHDRVSGLLSELGIRRLCCRIIFLSHVDSFEDELNMHGRQLGQVYGYTAGEISGTVKIIRTPQTDDGKRAKASALLAR
jgi:DNA-directed RNA polymerase subunit N (RpoN/RPB10)